MKETYEKVFQDNVDSFHLYKDKVENILNSCANDFDFSIIFKGEDYNGNKKFEVKDHREFTVNEVICEETTYIVFVKDILKYLEYHRERLVFEGVYRYVTPGYDVYYYVQLT